MRPVAKLPVPPALTATPIGTETGGLRTESVPTPAPLSPQPAVSGTLSPTPVPPGLVRVGDTPETLAARLGVAVGQLPQTFFAGEIVSPSQAPVVEAPAAEVPVAAPPAPPIAAGQQAGPAPALEAAAPEPPSGAADRTGSPAPLLAQEGGPPTGTVVYTGPQPDPLQIGYTGQTRAPFVPGYAPPEGIPYTGQTRAPFLPGYAPPEPAFIGPLRPGETAAGPGPP
jgi:hypothetical protein